MRPHFLPFALSLFLFAGYCSQAQETADNWQAILNARLPVFGHRNWIVIADSAYPAQTRPGIETIVSSADHIEVLQEVLQALEQSPHVRPTVYVDRELEFLDDKSVPGISAFRNQLSGILRERPAEKILHEQIIAKLDGISQTFRVLIIKTRMTMPYTSVFLQLDCAYWPPDAERRLRSAMARSH